MLKKLLSLGVMAVAMMNMAMAANYTVGGSNGGWDQSTDLTTWASSITFMEGDNLLFQYTLNHDVTEVSKADFDSCTTSNPVQGPYTSGTTVIALTSAGNRYFACGTGGHCIGGMKVGITTVAASVPSPPPATPAVPSPPPSTIPAVPSQPPSPAVASSPPKNSPSRPVSPPPSNVTAPSSPPKGVSPPPPPPPSGSSLPAPAPSSAAKLDMMGGLASFVVMIFLINV